MLNIDDIFQALGGGGLFDPTMVFIAKFCIWAVLACIVVRFFSLAFGRRWI